MTTAAAPLLSVRQAAVMIALGVTLWFGAVLLLRWLEPLGVLAAGSRLLTYALIVPGTLPFVLLARRLGGLARSQLPAGVALLTATALLLDGVATAWFPAFYGGDPAAVLACAAAILWGGGVGLILALAMAGRP